MYCYLSLNINSYTMRLYEFEDKDTSGKGSYAAVTFNPETVEALKAFQYDNNIPNPLSPDEFHSTVMFSQKYIPEFEVLSSIPEWGGVFRSWGIFPSDDEKALVLKYECHELSERFDEIVRDYGAKWDHPSFIPHITLSYNVGDLDFKNLPKYDGPIVIISEFNDDLDLGWSESRK